MEPAHPSREGSAAWERSFAKEIASLDEVFAFLEEFHAANAIGQKVALSICLVVEELFTNLVKYNTASRNPVVIRIARVGSEVNLELVDRDVDPFDPASLPEVDVTAPIEAREPGGLGFHLVRAIVDRISFDYHDRVMRIAAVKRLERGDV